MVRYVRGSKQNPTHVLACNPVPSTKHVFTVLLYYCTRHDTSSVVTAHMCAGEPCSHISSSSSFFFMTKCSPGYHRGSGCRTRYLILVLRLTSIRVHSSSDPGGRGGFSGCCSLFFFSLGEVVYEITVELFVSVI